MYILSGRCTRSSVRKGSIEQRTLLRNKIVSQTNVLTIKCMDQTTTHYRMKWALKLYKHIDKNFDIIFDHRYIMCPETFGSTGYNADQLVQQINFLSASVSNTSSIALIKVMKSIKSKIDAIWRENYQIAFAFLERRLNNDITNHIVGFIQNTAHTSSFI